jgi:hypothetical protein
MTYKQIRPRDTTFARDNPTELCSARAEATLGNLHLVEGFGIEDVEATDDIHEDRGQVHGTNDWADHEWVAFRIRDMVGMVVPIEGYGCF